MEKLPDEALVVPLAIFAARRSSFEVLIRAFLNSDAVLTIAFDELPLAEHNWNPLTTTITRTRSRHGWPVWRLSRGTQ